ncbi:MAG: glycosyltransferase family 39 protein [Candidatus Levybacteria bacterium]|nr:glycosyltransferase family 39 protein [Candidatus Levybacteria bacterium]
MIYLLKKYFPFLILVLFLVIKLSTLHVRASDTSIYFYTAKELLSGKILYKDVFFTNFPLVPYIASFYYLISHGNLLFYFSTAFFESSFTALIIYKIIIKSSPRIYAIQGVIIFLFSFIILATSQHQTGVFLVCLSTVLSYLFFQEKKYISSGVFTAFALLSKAYSLPLLISYLCILLIKEREGMIKFICGFLSCIAIILLPSLLLAYNDLLKDVFFYSLTRSQGISKLHIFWFAIKHDPLIFLLMFANIFWIKKRLFFGLFSLFSLLFFLFYKDSYYLYLVVMIPILILSFPEIVKDLLARFSINKNLITTIIGVAAIVNIMIFFSGYHSLQNIDIESMTKTINKENPKVLYGVNGITPALALATNKPLLNEIVDTNSNIFRKGYLNADHLTKDLMRNHGFFITEGVSYPELGISQEIYTDIVTTKDIKNNCTLIKKFPFRSEGISNTINFFQC